jgi:hypothetical protein
MSWVRRHALLSSSLGLLAILAGTGVSANTSSPNDTLYEFKLHVNDRIEAALARGEDARIDVELRQIDRQLSDEDEAADEVLVDDDSDSTDDDSIDEEPSDTPEISPEEDEDADDETSLRDDNAASHKQSKSKSNIVTRSPVVETDDGLDEDIKKAERELQQEESATIELQLQRDGGEDREDD